MAKRVGRVLRFPQLSLHILYVSQTLVCLSPCAQKYPTACERRLARTPCVPTALPACVRRGLCVPPSAPPPRSVQAASPRSLPAFRPRARGCRARLTALRRASPAAEKENRALSPPKSFASSRKENRAHSPPKSFASSASACLSRPPSADATPRAACASYVPCLQGIESSVGSPFCGWCGSNGAACASCAMHGQAEVRAGARCCAEDSRAPRGYEGGTRTADAAECSRMQRSTWVRVRDLPRARWKACVRKPRYSRNVAEMQPRCSRDVAEM